MSSVLVVDDYEPFRRFLCSTSADVIQEALKLGATGYVIKTRASELLAA
jgi:CheY-like chemotaxis protein